MAQQTTNSSSRRTLLKTAAVGAAAGVSAPLTARSAGAARATPIASSAARENQAVSQGGLSEERLERLHELMAGYVEQGNPPGLITLVSRGDDVDVDVAGVTAIDGSELMRRDSIFRIASMSKPITAAAAMILVEETKLRLDDPVDELLPELANRQVLRSVDAELDDTEPANRPITLRDLLTFTWGLGFAFSPDPENPYPIQAAMDEQLVGFVPNPQVAPEPDEWIRRLGTLPLIHQPGEEWLYHTGYDVLSVLIARAVDQPLDVVMQERLFTPLGMKDTGFSVPREKLDRLPTGYWTDFTTGQFTLFDDPENSNWSSPPAFPSGAGGMVSTVDDLYAFAQMMLNKGKLGNERVLSRPTVELMMSDQLTPAQKTVEGFVPGYWDNHGWGFGGCVVTARRLISDSVGKYGWDGGYGTSWYIDPAEEMITIFLTQSAFASAMPWPILQDFWTSAYQAIDD
jgi:CubicO group peptidase (beta-lactamase class C family)